MKKDRRLSSLFKLVGVVFVGVIGISLAQTVNPAHRSAADYSRQQRGSAVLIQQDGRIVFEAYQNGFDGRTPHMLASGSKSFSCAIAVALQDEGKLSLDEPVANTITEWLANPQKSLVTVRHLLQFTSGLPGDMNGGRAVRLYADFYAQAVALPLMALPGERYTYGNTHLAVFGELVWRKTGLDPAAYLQQKILEPIGARADWVRDQKGNPNLAASASMTARDWVRYGQLVLDEGIWQGKTVLSRSRLAECSARGSEALSIYGLTWWLNVPVAGTFDPDDDVPVRVLGDGSGRFERLAPSAPPEMFMAAGAFNQRLYILPSSRTVIVRFGQGGPWSDDEFLGRVLGKK
jgi:CubicO group peptidase (beta-lactamase class C family)